MNTLKDEFWMILIYLGQNKFFSLNQGLLSVDSDFLKDDVLVGYLPKVGLF